jgi:hypothetical protein
MTHSAVRFVLSVSSVVNKLFPVRLIKAGCGIIRCQIPKSIIYISNEEKLTEEWEESIIVHIYKKGDIIDFSNYCCQG